MILKKIYQKVNHQRGNLIKYCYVNKKYKYRSAMNSEAMYFDFSLLNEAFNKTLRHVGGIGKLGMILKKSLLVFREVLLFLADQTVLVIPKKERMINVKSFKKM